MTQPFGAAILGCAGTVLGADEAAFFAQANPFGFILFARNLETADQIRALCADLRSAVGWDAPVFIDQEGGRVQRMWPPLVRQWLPPLDDVARHGPNAQRAMYLRYRLIADELLSLGIDGNCAPLLDIARPDTHAVLRNRCYSDDLQTVVKIGQAVAQAHLDGGVLPVIKHIPGHGLALIDSHLDVPRVTLDRATLEAHDFAAFRPFARMPLGMTAHLIFEDIDPAPATISPVMNAVIRDSIGFGGLLMTDDISMQALSGTVAERGKAALAAGCDLVLHCNGNLAEMVSILETCGQMTPAGQARAEAALTWRNPAQEVDIAALEAELEALAAGRLE